MEVEHKTVVTFGVALVTWLTHIFVGGKAYGSLSARVDSQADDLIKVKARQDELDATIIKLLTTDGGEPRYVSYKAHDKMRDGCQRRYEDIFSRTQQEIADIKPQLAATHDAVLILAERSKNARTRKDD